MNENILLTLLICLWSLLKTLLTPDLMIWFHKNLFRVKKTSETLTEVGDSIGKAFSGFGVSATSKLAEMKYV